MRIDLIPVGDDPPNSLNVIIEVPVGGEPVKYEFDKASGALFVDRILHTPMRYPANYGFVPHTLSPDGDPLDALVIARSPFVPGCVVRARPIAVLKLEDEAGGDEKLICVPVDTTFPYYSDIGERGDLPSIVLQQIEHFFKHYKDLESEKWVRIGQWGDAEEAKRITREAIAAYDADKAAASQGLNMAADIPGVRIKAELLGLSETPVLHGRVLDAAALAATLGASVRARMATHANIGRSNVGGWHSASDMLDWGGPAAQTIADAAVRMAKRLSHFDGRDPQSVDWSVKMWANVSPPGAINMSRAHPGVLWAAVFYVDLGNPPAAGEAGGELYFEDPRFPLTLARLPGFRMIGIDGQPQPIERRIAPAVGDLIVFPCWLRHGVRPHQGRGDRISIAMNIDVRA